MERRAQEPEEKDMNRHMSTDVLLDFIIIASGSTEHRGKEVIIILGLLSAGLRLPGSQHRDTAIGRSSSK